MPQHETESVVISVRDILQQIKALKEQLKVYKHKLQSEIFWLLAKKKAVSEELGKLQELMKRVNDLIDGPPADEIFPYKRNTFGKDEIR